MEEVQKLSKPGTVAAMKAYFEARYKRVANKKSSVVPSYQQNQQNEVPRDFDDTSVMKFHKKSQMVSDSAKFSKTVFCYVTEKNDLVAGCCFLTLLSISMLLQKHMTWEMPWRKEK